MKTFSRDMNTDRLRLFLTRFHCRMVEGCTMFCESWLALVPQSAPHVILTRLPDGELQVDGFLADLMRVLEHQLNFTIQWVETLDGDYGVPSVNSTWTGLVGDLLKKRADVALSPLSQTLSRAAVIDFSPPVDHDAVRILVLNPEEPENLHWGTYVDAFHWYPPPQFLQNAIISLVTQNQIVMKTTRLKDILYNELVYRSYSLFTTSRRTVWAAVVVVWMVMSVGAVAVVRQSAQASVSDFLFSFLGALAQQGAPPSPQLLSFSHVLMSSSCKPTVNLHCIILSHSFI
ncbi:uncharacterized protein [Panulirus ornatus]|uniref:uncharacterized protein n=1 Tax=Panulirus ornatus TaxID=150431 RepID=UPI003A850431